jgi:hypothetical protein
MFYHLGGEKTTERGEEGSPLVSCARATRGRKLPSLDPRSKRPIRPPSGEVNEQARKEHFEARSLDGRKGINTGTIPRRRNKHFHPLRRQLSVRMN